MENMEEEYELVPVSPLKQIEKRIDRLERTGARPVEQEILEVMQTNQKIVDDLVRINSDLITKLSTMMSSISELIGRMNEFMGRVEVVGEEQPTEKPANEAKERELEEKISRLEKRMNSALLSRVPKATWEAMRKPAPAMP